MHIQKKISKQNKPDMYQVYTKYIGNATNSTQCNILSLQYTGT